MPSNSQIAIDHVKIQRYAPQKLQSDQIRKEDLNTKTAEIFIFFLHFLIHNYYIQRIFLIRMGSCQTQNRYHDSEARQIRLVRDVNTAEDADEKKKRRKIKSQETIKKEIYALFEDYDTNKDGKLSLQQLEWFLKDLQKDKAKKPLSYKKAAQELFLTLDRDLSNYIEKEQFYKYYKSA